MKLGQKLNKLVGLKGGHLNSDTFACFRVTAKNLDYHEGAGGRETEKNYRDSERGETGRQVVREGERLNESERKRDKVGTSQSTAWISPGSWQRCQSSNGHLSSQLICLVFGLIIYIYIIHMYI